MADWVIFGLGLWFGYVFGHTKGMSDLKTETTYHFIKDFAEKVLRAPKE